MNKPITRRQPNKSGCFSWGRFPLGDTGIVAYRLFRRDHRGAIHMRSVNFHTNESRDQIAYELRIAKRRLRDKVDDIDLAAMGVAA